MCFVSCGNSGVSRNGALSPKRWRRNLKLLENRERSVERGSSALIQVSESAQQRGQERRVDRGGIAGFGEIA